MFHRLAQDISCILERDPAARSRFEVLTCYPGLHALWMHRAAHGCWGAGWHWLGRFISNVARFLTGIEIHPGATIGCCVFIDHGMGIVIGETAVVGDGCTIYQGVTLGGTSIVKGSKRHPTLGANVIVGAGAQVIGGFTVGEGARIGSNAVVVREVPPGATAVGNPARILVADADKRREEQAAKLGFSAYGVTQGAQDPLAVALQSLIDHSGRQQVQIEQMQMALQRHGIQLNAHGNEDRIDTAELNRLVED